ncbi:MAG: hypothetical protein QM658_06490 [Gordonia sp. (in: high G+C Gram-positive bacteria)]
MAKDSDPDSRPISVEELIARTQAANNRAAGGGESFPRAGSAAAGRSDGSTASRATTASGMPEYRTEKPAQTPPAQRTVGASGMPEYQPTARPADAVTGIVPVVDDDEADTGELEIVSVDDPVGEELPAAQSGADPVAGSTGVLTKPAVLLVDDADDDDVDEVDHMASAVDLRDAEEPEDDVEEPRGEPSVLRQWLGLAGEAILGVAIGGGLFWGFTELWKRYVYLALILAIVVIFAVVTFAYVLRKRDLTTTLLALAVGLLVTIGPLVMLI